MAGRNPYKNLRRSKRYQFDKWRPRESFNSYSDHKTSNFCHFQKHLASNLNIIELSGTDRIGFCRFAPVTLIIPLVVHFTSVVVFVKILSISMIAASVSMKILPK